MGARRTRTDETWDTELAGYGGARNTDEGDWDRGTRARSDETGRWSSDRERDAERDRDQDERDWDSDRRERYGRGTRSHEDEDRGQDRGAREHGVGGGWSNPGRYEDEGRRGGEWTARGGRGDVYGNEEQGSRSERSARYADERGRSRAEYPETGGWTGGGYRDDEESGRRSYGSGRGAQWSEPDIYEDPHDGGRADWTGRRYGEERSDLRSEPYGRSRSDEPRSSARGDDERYGSRTRRSRNDRDYNDE